MEFLPPSRQGRQVFFGFSWRLGGLILFVCTVENRKLFLDADKREKRDLLFYRRQSAFIRFRQKRFDLLR